MVSSYKYQFADSGRVIVPDNSRHSKTAPTIAKTTPIIFRQTDMPLFATLPDTANKTIPTIMIKADSIGYIGLFL